jgi:ferrochelatase
MEKIQKTGIVLMNLGSPDSTSVGDVRRYLNQFLMDERVIDMSYISRLLLVRGIIVPFRAPKSAAAYRSIWTKEGSPLIVITRQLQAALKNIVSYPVEIAMRYGSPTPAEAYDGLLEKNADLREVIVVPLYPHYAMSSYETAVEFAREVHSKGKYSFSLKFIRPYYNEKAYINALANSFRPYLLQDYDHLLLSYHGVPERHIHKGDVTRSHCLRNGNCCDIPSEAHARCYRHQCFVTSQLVTQALSIPKDKYSISFQSRLGRDEWLKPYTAARLEALPSEGVKKLVVACPAFVSDCLETLEEIAEEGKEIFLHAGGESFTMIPCLNSDANWVETIAGYVRSVAEGKEEMLLR